MQRYPYILFACLSFALAPAALQAQPGASASKPQTVLARTFQNLDFEKPLHGFIPPDGTKRLFLVEQVGRIRILPEDRESAASQLFLDITERDLWENDFEEGLLGLAFHPDFKNNRRFFIYYSLQEPKRSVISEFTVSEDDPGKADMESERILLEVPQPFWNHNSGHLLFGPKDGYLYISLGDGGKANDPFNNSQDLRTLLGSVLRIDVDSRSGRLGYGIPGDNPFVGMGARARPEIWAYGLRNPWGIHFDWDTGDLWCADVGQNKYEEVNLIRKGANYGWNFREGLHAFDLNKKTPPADAQFVDPILEYGRMDGISVTGGLVYRGELFPDLKGAFLYGDWFSGKIWAAKQKDGQLESNGLIYQKPLISPIKIGGFSEDAEREVLVFSLDGTIWELKPQVKEPEPETPKAGGGKSAP